MKQFDWFEYTVFGCSLGVSLLIGVYFRKGQDSVKEYLLGGKSMSVFPITISLISSYISGVSLLGLPTEVYTHGIQYSIALVTNLVVAIVTLFLFLPVFYGLQLISLYEYLELRFNKTVRLLASFLFTVSRILYMPVVIYVPGLAFNQVSGVDVNIICPVLCIVCIIYTTMGGLKAVVWTDTVQGLLMYTTVILVVALGINRAGGITNIIQYAVMTNRTEFSFNPDPTERLTFWHASLGFLFNYLPIVSVSPSVIQRFTALPTLVHARISAIMLGIGTDLLVGPSLFLGLIIATVYKDCDPLLSKAINRPDQILPYFVLDVAGHIRGLPGLFVVGICSAALSTMSTGLNTVAGTIYEDFVVPSMKGKVEEKKASRIIKALVLIIGVICVALVALVEKMGKIIDVYICLSGITNGTLLGIFVLGMFIPRANAKGALVGGLAGLGVMTWIITGAQIITARGQVVHSTKHVSIHGCNLTTPLLMNVTNTTATPFLGEEGEPWVVYRLSMFFYCLIGCLVVLAVGLAVSFLTAPPPRLSPELFSPPIRRFLPRGEEYKVVPLKMENNDLKDVSSEKIKC